MSEYNELERIARKSAEELAETTTSDLYVHIAQLKVDKAALKEELRSCKTGYAEKHDVFFERRMKEIEELKTLQEQVNDFEASFELYHSASMRAIKMWKKTTGEGLVWPDQAHLIVHVMEENTALQKQVEGLQERKINCIHCAREMILTKNGIKLLPIDEHGHIKMEAPENHNDSD